MVGPLRLLLLPLSKRSNDFDNESSISGASLVSSVGSRVLVVDVVVGRGGGGGRRRALPPRPPRGC